MARHRRPSGLGPNQRRFAVRETPDGREFLVPLTQDAATYIYIATSERGWPAEHAAKMLYDVHWMTEGTIIELENLAPPMGYMGSYQIIETRLIVAIDQPRGGTSKRATEGFGQVKRLVLVEAIPDLDDVGELSAEALA